VCPVGPSAAERTRRRRRRDRGLLVRSRSRRCAARVGAPRTGGAPQASSSRRRRSAGSWCG